MSEMKIHHQDLAVRKSSWQIMIMQIQKARVMLVLKVQALRTQQRGRDLMTILCWSLPHLPWTSLQKMQHLHLRMNGIFSVRMWPVPSDTWGIKICNEGLSLRSNQQSFKQQSPQEFHISIIIKEMIHFLPSYNSHHTKWLKTCWYYKNDS